MQDLTLHGTVEGRRDDRLNLIRFIKGTSYLGYQKFGNPPM